MKKIIAVFCALMLALSCFAVPVLAKDGAKALDSGVSLTLDTVYAEPDSDVSVTLSIAGEYAATALTLFVRYDGELLALNADPVPGDVWNEITGGQGLVQTDTETPGRFGFVGIMPQDDFGAEGSVFTLSFHVSASAQAGHTLPLTIEVRQFTYDALDGSVTNIAYTAVDGAVEVAPCPISEPVRFVMSSAIAAPGGEASLTLSIEGSVQATALTLFVNYDSELLTLAGEPEHGAVWDDIAQNEGLVQTNTGTPGRFGFVGIVAQGDFTAAGSLFTLTFNVAGDVPDGTQIPVSIEIRQFSYDALDGSVLNIPAQGVDGVITVMEGFLLGDANCDGKVTMADVSALIAKVMNVEDLSAQGMINADANLDGRVDILDAAAIYAIAFSN